MKKIICFLLTFLLFFTLVACNESSGDSNTNINYESLGGETIVFYVGETGTFEEGYTYKTNNTDVIELNGNAYRTLKEGSAVVTVEKDNNKIGVYVIAVYGSKQTSLNDLIILNKPTTLTVQNVVKLEYQKDPIDANNFDSIVWSSSNEEIATVDRDGNITPLKMGEVTITLTAIDTNVKKELTFTVLPRDTRFELNYDAIVGVCDTTEKVLIPDVLTDYPFDGNVTWFTEDSSIVEVDENGVTTFNNPGTTYVGIKAEIDHKPISFRCKVTVLEDMGYTIIRTPEQLQEIENNSGYYMLGNDIDMLEAVSEGGSLYNNGKGFMPLFESGDKAFKGVFDGNGFSIKNMYMNRQNDVFVAFMRYISAVEGEEGLIKRLSFIGGEISGGNYTAVYYANSYGYGSVNSGLRDCFTNIKVTSIGSLSTLVGNNRGKVENCIVMSEFEAVGEAYLFALNNTGTVDGIGVNNCVYIGSNTTAEFAKLTHGGFATNCRRLTAEQVKLFEFNMGNAWSWTSGSLPVLKGV